MPLDEFGAAFEAKQRADLQAERDGAIAEAAAAQRERDTARTQLKVCQDALGLMVSYLGHYDQDADHSWMVRKMRAALGGESVYAALDAEMKAMGFEVPP